MFSVEGCIGFSFVITASRVDIEVCPSEAPEMGLGRRN
jgi:hypothetical protein